jgi:aminoglycoside phosphotransferase (APT) family kinase protein
MNSKTKANVTEAQVKDLIKKVMPQKPGISAVYCLNGGMFNISYKLEFIDQSAVVIKIGTPRDVELLSYEKQMMSTELKIHHLIEHKTTVPLPRILYIDQSRQMIPYEFFIMESLEGKPLNEIETKSTEDIHSIGKELARSMAEIHQIKGAFYGYEIMKDDLMGKSYYQAFCHMVDRVIYDGNRKNVQLPISPEKIRDIIQNHQRVFENCGDPVLVHFDLWEGNLFVKSSKKGPLQLEALIDFERGFFGDPAAEIIHISGLINLDDSPWFFQEYNRHASTPLKWDRKTQTRSKIFWMY